MRSINLLLFPLCLFFCACGAPELSLNKRNATKQGDHGTKYEYFRMTADNPTLHLASGDVAEVIGYNAGVPNLVLNVKIRNKVYKQQVVHLSQQTGMMTQKEVDSLLEEVSSEVREAMTKAIATEWPKPEDSLKQRSHFYEL